MTKGLWIFPAIACIPLLIIGVTHHFWLGIVLYVFWFIRILCLKHKETLIMTVLINLLFCGALFFHQNRNQTKLDPVEREFIIFPRASSVKIDGDNFRFEGVVQSETCTEKIVVHYRLKTEAEKEKWSQRSLTDFLYIKGELKEPSENRNFYQFNYRDYLNQQNIHWQLEAENIQHVESEELKKPMFSFMESLRVKIFHYIDETFHPLIGSYLKILLFADKRDFSELTLKNYRAIGVIHLFSISGFHISYLVRLIRHLLLRLGITHERTNLVLISILPFYCWLAGLGVSIFRATFHSFIILVGQIRKIKITPLDAWSFTILIALFLNPYQALGISFQLSYLLSGLFILMSNQDWIQKLTVFLQNGLFCLMSTLASLPILAYHFFEFSWITIFTNVLFIPFFTYIFFPALLILFCVSPLIASTFLFSLLNDLLAAIIILLEKGLTLFNKTFDFSFVIGRLPILVTLFFIWCTFKILSNIENKKWPSFISVGGLLFSLFFYQISPVGYVLVLDVGQGDSILIKEPITGKVTMIDTGGEVSWETEEAWQKRDQNYSIGSQTIAPSLKSLGISRVDCLYITHADTDHCGEIQSLGNCLPIKKIVATKATFKDEMIQKQIQTLKNTKLQIIKPPSVVEYPTKNTLAIYPINEEESKNNDSLTLYVKIGEDTWLFTGDIQTEAEQEIRARYPNLRVNNLKVAHHGSKTSTTQELLNQIQPHQAFISAGKNNSYGHPNEEVLKRLEEMNIHTFTTAEQGAIMVKYYKIPFVKHWFIKTYTVYKN